VFFDLLERYGLSGPRGVELLISPGGSYKDLGNRIKMISSGGACGMSGYLQGRVQRLLCAPETTPEVAAATLINTPIVIDAGLAVSEWLIAASRFGDLLDQKKGEFIAKDDVLKYARSAATGESPGHDILEKTLSVLDAATSGYSLVYGDLTARAIGDVLFGPPPTDVNKAKHKEELAKQALPMLRQNPFLAANVVMIVLHDRFHARSGVSPEQAPSEITYRTAYEFALDTQADPGLMLRGMFGDDLKFVVDREKRRVQLNLSGSDKPDEITLGALAEPTQFVSGRFIYPRRMTELARLRERVWERLADYAAFSNLTSKETEAAVLAVARAEKKQ
jgi:hypothetical protein